MSKKSYEFEEPRFSDVEQRLEERKNRIRTIRYRICSKCKQRKPVSKFSTDKRNIGGQTAICKKCRSKEALNHYYQNKEQILIKIKEYQDKKDRSKYFQDYWGDHEKHLKEVAGKWYKKNRKRIKKRNLERKANLK